MISSGVYCLYSRFSALFIGGLVAIGFIAFCVDVFLADCDGFVLPCAAVSVHNSLEDKSASVFVDLRFSVEFFGVDDATSPKSKNKSLLFILKSILITQ